MRLRELLDRDAAAEHREAEAAELFRRVGAEQSHPAQAGHRALRHLAGRFDCGVMGLKLAAHELAHPALQNAKIVRKLELHASPEVE